MASNFSKSTLLDLLVNKGYLSNDQLSLLIKKAEEENVTLEDVIESQNIVSEDELVKMKSEILNIPYIDLSGENISQEVFKGFPQDVDLRYKFTPFKKEGNCIYVAMVDPEDVNALEALKFISLKNGLDWKIFITAYSGFKDVMGQYSNIITEVGQALDVLKKEKSEEEGAEKITAKEIERISQEAPISKVVSVILKHAVEGGASDIHIEPTEKDLRVRYRIDGILHISLILARKISPAVVARIKVLSNLKLDEQRKPQDGRFNAVIDKRTIDFRVSTFPITGGEKVVMRILDKSVGIKHLSDLGFSENDQKILEKATERPYGTILVTGPTGSGKSTTLYAILGILNEEGVNIVTLEDPVEYFLEGANQSQIHPEIGYTFATGLRSILRQDPDVIMVGEIRDGETAELAVHAALTGHIVLSTLHTNTATGAIPRLIDMGIEPFLVTSALSVIVAQRLVRRICDHCKEEIQIPEKIKEDIKKEILNMPEQIGKEYLNEKEIKLYKGTGCKYCGQKGTKGRIVIDEILIVTAELEKMTAQKPTESQILTEAKRQGMVTMKQDGILKALQGLVNLEEVLKSVED